ncbi:MAG TPA: YicC/YloC family endoribonuclease [Acidobacteriaceae bacterium]|nr:YicC/YloC family endoribonuclease [Acidobacteriaceae bacterium]
MSRASNPIYSMTGFARISGRTAGSLVWTLTLKSVNHRYLDLHMRMPAGTEALEMRLRRILKEKVVRGHLEVTLNLERSAEGAAEFDRKLLHAYLAAFREAAAENGLIDQPDLNAIFRLPGILTGEGRSTEEQMEALEQDVTGQMTSLLTALNAMRAEEGKALVQLLNASMERLEAAVIEAGDLRLEVQEAYFERLRQRLSEMLNGVMDRDRLLQEAALLAERSDVEEEVARLRTHIQHFRSQIETGGEVGKKLDFLLQEMNREANTLLSKTGGISGNGQRITEMGLRMKSEIEKAREQVQNLE